MLEGFDGRIMDWQGMDIALTQAYTYLGYAEKVDLIRGGV